MLTQVSGSVYQMAYIVADIRSAAERWARLTGAGPFMLFEHFQFNDPQYHGKPADVDISIALGFSAGLCVELIEQHDERSSIYHDWRMQKGYGLHHVAVLSEDFPRDIERWAALEAPAVFTAGFGENTRLAYLDTREALGHYLEVVEFTDFVRSALIDLREAQEGWDGKDVVRLFGS
jgi:hypothetical protein